MKKGRRVVSGAEKDTDAFMLVFCLNRGTGKS